jgi:hypothetical protein
MRSTLALFIAIGLIRSAEANIAIDEAVTVAVAADGIHADVTELKNPRGDAATANFLASTSSTISSYLTAGDSANLTATFSDLRTGELHRSSYGYVEVSFATAAYVPYKVAGTYSSTQGESELYSFLYDTDDSVYLYESLQVSQGMAAEFRLGEYSGNLSNIHDGNLTGFLLPGHFYHWYAFTSTTASPAADAGATADGAASLTIGSVPEAPIGRYFLSLLVFVACRRRTSHNRL